MLLGGDRWGGDRRWSEKSTKETIVSAERLFYPPVFVLGHGDNQKASPTVWTDLL